MHFPTVAQLNSLADGDYAIMPPPSKSDQYGRRWGNNPIWLPVDPTAAINAALHLAQWELCACVTPQKRESTPLFCGPNGVGSPLKASEIDDVFHRLLARVVDEGDDATNYSMHSWCSFLASSLMAAGQEGRLDGFVSNPGDQLTGSVAELPNFSEVLDKLRHSLSSWRPTRPLPGTSARNGAPVTLRRPVRRPSFN